MPILMLMLMPRCRCQVFEGANYAMKLSQRISSFPEGAIYSIFKHKKKEWGMQMQSLTHLKSNTIALKHNKSISYVCKVVGTRDYKYFPYTKQHGNGKYERMSTTGSNFFTKF